MKIELIDSLLQPHSEYGYGICSQQTAHVEEFGRYLGQAARGWGIRRYPQQSHWRNER